MGHKNNACRDNNGRAGPDLGPMAGEISPNIMFFEIRRRSAQMHTNACMMGLDGCSRMGEHGGTGK